VLGVNLFFTKPIFSLWRNLRYVLIGLLVLSTSFAFVTQGALFSWGGAMGEYCSSWLVKWIGSFGTGSLLLVAGLCYIIWRFNPIFKVPSLNFLLPKKQEETFVSEDTEEAVKQEWDLNAPENKQEVSEWMDALDGDVGRRWKEHRDGILSADPFSTAAA
jgi:S-DNA-T family DNA segregation ATPase FtsK/SpoIIIE